MLPAIVGHLNIEVNEDELDKDFADWLDAPYIHAHASLLYVVRYVIMMSSDYSYLVKSVKTLSVVNSFDICVLSFAFNLKYRKNLSVA